MKKLIMVFIVISTIISINVFSNEITILGKQFDIQKLREEASNTDVMEHYQAIRRIKVFAKKQLDNDNLSGTKYDKLVNTLNLLSEYENRFIPNWLKNTRQSVEQLMMEMDYTQPDLFTICEVEPGVIAIFAYNIKEDFIFNKLVFIPEELMERELPFSNEVSRSNLPEDKLIIAHRGIYAGGDVLKCKEKGNKMEDFNKAVELGVEWIELDLRRTKDKKIVVFHDGSILKKKKNNFNKHGSKFTSVKISWNNYDYVKEVVKEKYDYDLDLFEDVLKNLSGKVKLDIELKEEGYELEVIDMARKYFKDEDLMICTFWKGSINKIKNNRPGIKTALLMGDFFIPYYAILANLEEIFPTEMLLEYMPDYIIPNSNLAKFGFYKKAHKYGIKLMLWTINEKSDIKKALNNSYVHGIITDYPLRAQEIYRK